MTILNQTFANQAIILDGAEFCGCRFTNCKVVFSGRALPLLRDNTFENCEFVLEDAARVTMNFLKNMVDSSDGFLLTLIKALSLDAGRLDRLAANPNAAFAQDPA